MRQLFAKSDIPQKCCLLWEKRVLFSDPWSAQLLAVNFFFFPLISNYLAVFLKHFDGGKEVILSQMF